MKMPQNPDEENYGKTVMSLKLLLQFPIPSTHSPLITVILGELKKPIRKPRSTKLIDIIQDRIVSAEEGKAHFERLREACA